MALMKYFALIALIAVVASNKMVIQSIEPEIHHGPKARGLVTLDIDDDNNFGDMMEFRRINIPKLTACLEPVKADYEEVFTYMEAKNYLGAYVTLVNIKNKGGEKGAKAKECIDGAMTKKAFPKAEDKDA